MSAAALLALLLQSVPAGGTHHAQSYPYQGVETVAYENEVNFFHNYDSNRNDVVDRRELDVIAANADRRLALRTPAGKGQLIATMHAAFAALDRNGDGRVTRTEFQAANRQS
ncbi:EF-hand domain-containing protein [Sphingomonas sp. 2R-10]|uniref:EF-hand domain-containing protein n=1 Tax=Sphingomonas sp. 2R-10 TaxID=3045148 RepID=UPI0013DE6D24|nr:EF-hand domain-containing protein [Sphingomonas sp. 2R-10]MDJ0277201.1 EF-hand domain-containing protein [Sphingomonas sp. 2R-10]